MHVHTRRTAALALLAAGATILGASCANEDTSIFIRGCLAVPHDTCTVTAAITSTESLAGQIDAAYAGEYRCFALVENNMVPQQDQNTLKTETNGVQLYEAEVQVLDSTGAVVTYNGGASAAAFSVPVSGYVDPSQSGTAGVGISLVTMIDAGTMQALGKAVIATKIQQQVTASVVIKGRTLGGFEVHTNEFLYPITIGYGNSCGVPAGQTCVGSNATSTADCLLGQDEGFTNCQDIAGQLGFCHYLECGPPIFDPTTGTNVPNYAAAHCPTSVPADNSCCP